MKSLKTPTLIKCEHDIVYKIKCIQCNGTYIGQTGRCLHTRMLEHARSTKNYKTITTALAQHAHNFKHNFDFKEINIFEQEQNFKKDFASK